MRDGWALQSIVPKIYNNEFYIFHQSLRYYSHSRQQLFHRIKVCWRRLSEQESSIWLWIHSLSSFRAWGVTRLAAAGRKWASRKEEIHLRLRFKRSRRDYVFASISTRTLRRGGDIDWIYLKNRERQIQKANRRPLSLDFFFLRCIDRPVNF